MPFFAGDTYNEIARSVAATPEQREAQRARLVAQAETLIKRDGVEAILLAGTDLSAVFNANNTPFPHLDCAAVHIDAIMRRLDC
jgi:aspartate racemase|eukprot:COSAG06_NODE_2020_length_7835_cov_3.118795_12_plen_84_part_00